MPGDGPIPKRSDQRRRRNKTTGAAIVKAPTSSKAPKAPEADTNWHPIALEWFKSLSESGQAQFYEASDWATARYVAEAMSRNLKAGARFSAVLFAAVMSGMTELLTTEGARRRARMELQRTPEISPSVAMMDDYRRGIKATSA